MKSRIQDWASDHAKALPILSIRSERGRRIRFKPNRVQKHILAVRQKLVDEGKPVRLIVLKARRHGVTTLAQALGYCKVWLHKNQQVTTLAHTRESSETIFRIGDYFHQNLPGKVRPKRLTARSKRTIDYPGLNSLYYVGTAGGRGPGRGDTLQFVHWSEVAKSAGDVDEQQDILAGLAEAAREGEMILESTAQGRTGLFYELWQEAQDPASDWVPLFFPWWMDDRNVLGGVREDFLDVLETLTDEEDALIENENLSAGQIAWRRWKKAQPEMRRGMFDQEYAESPAACFLASGTTFFDVEVLLSLRSECQDTQEQLVRFEPPDPEHSYVIGADVGEGVPDGSRSVGGVLDTVTLRQVAVLSGRWRPHDFAQRLVKLAREYNEAMIAVERNNHGHSVINTLQNQVGYPNLYRHLEYDRASKTHVQKVGYPTNVSTREILIDGAREATEDGLMRVRDIRYVDECLDFSLSRAGKYESATGHDDHIFAWAIAWQARRRALPVDFGPIVGDTLETKRPGFFDEGLTTDVDPDRLDVTEAYASLGTDDDDDPGRSEVEEAML